MIRDVEGGEAVARLRLFVALPVPATGAAAIHEALAPHRRAHPDARWLAPALYHVTLRFLGQVDGALAPHLEDIVARCAEGQRPFQVVVGRGGGARGRSAAAWLSVLDGREAIEALADQLDALLPHAIRDGLRPGRPAPHLTIARRAPAGLADSLADESLGRVRVAWSADQVTLFRSHTGTPAGSSYEPLVEAAFGGSRAA